MENQIAQPRVRRKHRSLAQELVTELIGPERYVAERHLCIDTTAAGGNASLLASSS